MPNSEIVDAAITSRRSMRAFLSTPVPKEEIVDILNTASRAPSGTNMQPWQVYVVTGERKNSLSAAVLEAFYDPDFKPDYVYQYYPDDFPEPYKARRRKVGLDLYGLLDIKKGDTEKMQAQHARNFTFFDAPVGLIFTIDDRLKIGSWLDYGMFLQNIMVAARAIGLDTCPQAAFAPYHKVIRPQLNIPDNQIVICGMALGYADYLTPVNSLITERVPVEEFTKFMD